MEIKQGITKEQQLDVIKWAYEHFKELIDEDYFVEYAYEVTNWEKSIMLMDDDKIMGLYLFGDHQLSLLVKNTEYDNLIGIEGVLLAIDSSIRGLGWGNKLKDYPKTLGVDYIWGQQLKTLNNLNDWLKRRIYIDETNHVYITLEKFN